VISLADLTAAHYEPLPMAAASPQEVAERCLSCGTCRDCHLCETICPTQAISREILPDDSYRYVADDNKCIACGFCADTCPCGIWVLQPF
jgi:ferredoxin